MFDAKSFNQLFNLFFFSYTVAALFILWWENFKNEQSERKSKSLWWFAVSVGISLLSSGWAYFTKADWPGESYVWGVSFPMICFSVLNSIAVFFSLEHFFRRPEQHYKIIRTLILVVGAGVILWTSYLLHTNSYRVNEANKDINTYELKRDSAFSTSSILKVTLEIEGEKAERNTVVFNNFPDSIEHQKGIIKEFKKETRVADLFASILVGLAFLAFILYVFLFSEMKSKRFVSLGSIYLVLFGGSQYLGSRPTDSNAFISSVLFPVVNSLQVVFYLLVLLTWALEKVKTGKMQQATDSFTPSEKAEPDENPGEPNPATIFLGKMNRPENYETYQKKIEKAKKDDPNLVKFLEALCRGEEKSKIAEDHRKSTKWVNDRQAAISRKLGIKNDIENLLLFSVIYGLVHPSEVKITPDE